MSDQPDKKPAKGDPPDKELPAHEILSSLFKTIIDEAERNARFAEDMLKALPDGLIAKIDVADNPAEKPAAEKATAASDETKAPKTTTKKSEKQGFDPRPFNPVILYRKRGEDLMRVDLQKLTIANLTAIIRHFQLKKKLKLPAKAPTKPHLITALIAFAKHYDEQRKGAAA